VILAFGTYDASRHPRIAVLIEGLRTEGFNVAEVNRPLGFTTVQRVRMLQQPWRVVTLVARLAICWAGLVSDSVRVRRQFGEPRVVLVGYMGHFDVVLTRLLFPQSLIVLDHLVFAGDTARDRGSRGLRVRLLRGLDRIATFCADSVIVDTDEHRNMLRYSEKGVVVPVGATRAWFDAGANRTQAMAGDGPLRVIFFGLFTPLQGAVVAAQGISMALDAGADLAVTIVGTGQDYEASRAVLACHDSAVTWIDWVEPAALPAIVATHDVCLGIFSRTPKGLRVVPNKVYEGLAAGCIVVTSDTAPQRRNLGDACEYCAPADSTALSVMLHDLASDTDRCSDARRRAWAGRESLEPEVIVKPLIDLFRSRDVT
jgi:glycosyltransferase involved in cell wall biosynthesis